MDIISVEYNEYKKALDSVERMFCYSIPKIKNVIFNDPATIVFWNDNTKTVVKCQNGDEFDPEKGITMAFFKKTHGNIGHYFEEIKKWTEKYEPKDCYTPFDPETEKVVIEGLKALTEKLNGIAKFNFIVANDNESDDKCQSN